MNTSTNFHVVRGASCGWLFAPSARLVWGFVLSVALGSASTAVSAQASVNLSQQTASRTVQYTYLPNGLLQSETREPGGPQAVSLTTSYAYDLKGNRTQIHRTGWDGSAVVDRPAGASYDVNGLYPVASTNALGQAEQKEYDPRFGTVTKQVRPDGVTTQWSYDDFGRPVQERRGYASAAASTYLQRTEWTYQSCADVSCAAVQGQAPAMVVTEAIKSYSGVALGPVVKTYSDALNRKIRIETQGMKSGAVQAVYQDTVYNSTGQLAQASEPYFSGDTPVWRKFLYDAKGRVASETALNNVVTTHRYNGTSETITVNAVEGPLVKTLVRESSGFVETVTDAAGKSAHYAYEPFGQMSHSVDTYGHVIETSYDAAGRVTARTDLDSGTWRIGWNAFGEQITTQDPRGAVVSMVYDLLGRMTGRSASDLSSHFQYVASGAGLNQLAQTWTDNGYCRQHAYDALGRNVRTTVMLTGASACTAPTETYTSSMSFDDANGGRVSKQQYPSGVTVVHGYQATLGFLETLTDGTGGGSGPVFWRWRESDAAGRTTRYTYGNSVGTLRNYDSTNGRITQLVAGTGDSPALANVQSQVFAYDSLGNLKSRADQDATPPTSEKFTHDNLGRLTAWGRYDGSGALVPGSAQAVSFDAIGNILSKTDVGTYYYDPAKPHIVVAVRGVVNADLRSDAAGNVVADGRHSYAYTASDLPRMAGSASVCHEFQFESEDRRVQQTVYASGCRADGNGLPANGGSPVVSKTLYLHPDAANGLSFERINTASGTVYRHYITAGSLVVGVLETNTLAVTTSGTGSMRYFHYDTQGSIVAVTGPTGAFLTRQSFDPWGRPTDASGAGMTGLPGGMSPIIDRGYTLQEHLEGVDTIHMNGRLYDPLLARFTAADPLVSRPYEAQNLNRYSYVENRPLDASDPTGMDPELQKVDVPGGKMPNFTDISPFAPGGSQVLNMGGLNIGINASRGSNIGNAATPGCPAASGCLAASGNGKSDAHKLFSSIKSFITGPDFSTYDEAQLLDACSGGALGACFEGASRLEDEGRTPYSMSASLAGFFQVVAAVVPLEGAAGKAAGAMMGGERAIRTGEVAAKGLGHQNPLYKAAVGPFKNTGLSNAGRALTKHPEVIGQTKETLRQGLRTDGAVNDAARASLKDIMRNGTTTTQTLGRYGNVTQIQIPGGFGARWASDGSFIGFINP